MTDSELVTEPVRALFAERFGVPVCDEYSAYEVLTVGSQCRFGSMHVDEDRVVLELVDDDGVPVPDGTEGAVVVTHYRERAMPLVRYWLGDRAIALAPGCRCGSNFRRRAGRAFDEVAADTRARFAAHLGIDLDMDVVPIDKVPITPGGKARLIQSEYRVPAAGRP
jgi:phenylacetate-CoA ligase